MFWNDMKILAIIAVVMGLIFWAVACKPQEAHAAELTPANIIMLMNRDRAAAHLPALKESKVLDRSAALKANDEVKHEYFAHTSPAGLGLVHWLKVARYKYQVAGENLAIGFDQADDAETAFMASPTHRANILNRNYRDVGISVIGEYVVIHFGMKL